MGTPGRFEQGSGIPAEGDAEGHGQAAFRPSGIYADNPRMERYFRAVRWLQTVPFDLRRDDQLAAMGPVIAAFDEAKTVTEISKAFEQIMGSGSVVDALDLSHRSQLCGGLLLAGGAWR